MKQKKKKLSDYKQDLTNFNKGNAFGESLIEKSISKLGAGRSLLAASDGTLIAGNKSQQKFSELGFDKVIEVETDGTTVVVVKRTDIKAGSKKFHELALADNISALKNISIDEVLAEEVLTEEVCKEWGLGNEINFDNVESNAERENKAQSKEVTCPHCGNKFQT